jgi:hypothetical protein
VGKDGKSSPQADLRGNFDRIAAREMVSEPKAKDMNVPATAKL